ncbi:hypothetical protein SY88_17835 [Clostridiales bacterium PH28_bin88]|nr:hypothetical protein SY88_17835 [Clostridiales bacterium PH28_bin88]
MGTTPLRQQHLNIIKTAGWKDDGEIAANVKAYYVRFTTALFAFIAFFAQAIFCYTAYILCRRKTRGFFQPAGNFLTVKELCF